MSEAKTKPFPASVEDYLDSKASPEQLADCRALMALLKRVTKQNPKLSGPGVVAYGSYQYTYESGRTGTSCLAGFAIRGREIVIYLAPYWEGITDLLPKLGKHKMGKGCLYIKRTTEIDMSVLEAIVSGSVAELRRRYPAAGGA